MLCARCLCNKHRRNARQSTGTKTRNDTCNKDEGGALGSGLQGTSDESENGGEEKTINTSDPISSPATDEAADDGTEVVL